MDATDLYEKMLESLEMLIRALEKEDYLTAETAVNLVIERSLFIKKGYIVSDLPGDCPPRLFELLSTVLEKYFDLADKLFGKNPYEDLNRNFQDQVSKAKVWLNSRSVHSVNEVRKVKALINNALNHYDIEVTKVKTGDNLDSKAVRLYWRIWPALDMIISKLPTDEYSTLTSQLYGIISEGLQSLVAVKILKELYDDLFPFKSG